MVSDNKSELRKIIKQKRTELPVEENSRIICEKIKNLNCYKEAENILMYSPLPFETNTKFLLTDDKKKFYLPRVNGDELEICPYISDENCTKNKWGILEPKCKAIEDLSIIDTAIIPALCADKKGYRLGYGKGYYDRFLPKLKETCKKIIPISEELVFDSIPVNETDICCNMIITQRNVIYI